jgi:hypothetical protein
MRGRWAAYGATAWAFVFAAISFYWAAGGLVGVDTLGEGMRELALARDPELGAITWITGILKVVAGLFALSLVQAWGQRIPRWIRLAAVWGAGLLFIFYAVGNMVQHGSMAAGTSAIPEVLGSITAVRWHLLFWDPFWLLGGLLFVAAAFYHTRNARQQ